MIRDRAQLRTLLPAGCRLTQPIAEARAGRRHDGNDENGERAYSDPDNRGVR